MIVLNTISVFVKYIMGTKLINYLIKIVTHAVRNFDGFCYIYDPLSYVTCYFQFCFLVTHHCFIQFGLCPSELSYTLLSNHIVVIVIW